MVLPLLILEMEVTETVLLRGWGQVVVQLLILLKVVATVVTEVHRAEVVALKLGGLEVMEAMEAEVK